MVGQILNGLVSSNQVPVERADAPAARPVIERAVREAVRDEMTPRLRHVTNQEPWYQSRVTWGSLISIAAGVLGIIGYAEWDERQQAERVDQIMALVPVVMPILGGVFSLIGRWFSTKPLGASLGTRNGGA
jgi:hypothetical protein